MGCATCAIGGGCGSKTNGGAAGCGSKGNCSCNRLNTYDWLSDIDLPPLDDFNVVEVSFKQGSRKSFFFNHFPGRVSTGDMVVVESGAGFDVGRISLSGELVKLQMRRKKVKDVGLLPAIIRRANERDLERLADARAEEKNAMVMARAISRQLGLKMKIGDVEYQGDKRKATFYYTADGRVDFRELIKLYAREFRVKIEMRQIGARQESARIGGIGSCGRELCCSTWLSDFKSVSTAAARYQNLAINQSKLSGQCGRLKCCLNFELDTYMDALEDFPRKADKLETEAGTAILIKTDIFKRTMYYIYQKQGFSKTYALDVERVKEIKKLNKAGEKPVELGQSRILVEVDDDEDNYDDGYGDVTGGVELSDLDKNSKSKKRRRNRNKKKSKDSSGAGGSSKSNASKAQNKSSQSNRNKGGASKQNAGNDQNKNSNNAKSGSGNSNKSNKGSSSRSRSNRRGNSNRNDSDQNRGNNSAPKNTPNKPVNNNEQRQQEDNNKASSGNSNNKNSNRSRRNRGRGNKPKSDQSPQQPNNKGENANPNQPNKDKEGKKPTRNRPPRRRPRNRNNNRNNNDKDSKE